MDVYIGSLLLVLAYFFCQTVLSGGLAAFSVLSRTSGDKAFPKEVIGWRLLRLMHRERLHLVLIMIMTAVMAMMTLQVMATTMSRMITMTTAISLVLLVTVPRLLLLVTLLLIGMFSSLQLMKG